MLFNVGKLIVSNYVALSINNRLQDALATRAESCIQNSVLCKTLFCTQLTKALVAKTFYIQLLIVLLHNCSQSIHLIRVCYYIYLLIMDFRIYTHSIIDPGMKFS